MKEARITDKEFEPREGIDERLAEQEWLVHGEVARGVARVWVAPERARWLREERTVVEGSPTVRWSSKSRTGRLAGPRDPQGCRRPGRPRATTTRARRYSLPSPRSGARMGELSPGVVEPAHS